MLKCYDAKMHKVHKMQKMHKNAQKLEFLKLLKTQDFVPLVFKYPSRARG